MKNTFLVIQIILSTLFALLILIQSRGKGIGRSWGGSASSFTRRGLEKIMFKATFVMALLFILISIIQLTL